MRHPLRAALLRNTQTPGVELADYKVDGFANLRRRSRGVELSPPLPGGVNRLLQRFHGKAQRHCGTAILPVRERLAPGRPAITQRRTLQRALHGLEQMGEWAADSQRLGSIVEEQQRLIAVIALDAGDRPQIDD